MSITTDNVTVSPCPPSHILPSALPPPPPSLPPPPNLLLPPNFPPPEQALVIDTPAPSIKEIRFLCERLSNDLRKKKQQSYNLFYLCNAAKPTIQNGPQCGPVSVCMAHSVLHGNHYVTPDEVMLKAKRLQYSLQGEIFNAAEMLALATDVCGCCGYMISDLSSEVGHPHPIISALLNRELVLMPYDKDGNGAPCMKQGEKAHWALLTGVVLTELESHDSTIPICYTRSQDLELPNLYSLQSSDNIHTYSALSHMQCYVFAQHGLSKHLNLWSLQDLLQSNLNLKRLDPKICASLESYAVKNPNNDPLSELRGKAIVLLKIK